MSKPKNSNISSENQSLIADENLKQNIILGIYETFYSVPLGLPSGILSYDQIPSNEKKILEESWEKNASAMEDVAKNGKEFLEIVIKEVFGKTSKEKPEEFFKNTIADISKLVGDSGISNKFKGTTVDELAYIVFFSALNLAITEGKNPELKAIDEFLFPVDKFFSPDSKAEATSDYAPQISFEGFTHLAALMTGMAGLSFLPTTAAQTTAQPTAQPFTPFPGAKAVLYQTGVDSQNKPVMEEYKVNGQSVFAGVYNDRINIAYFNGTNYTTVVLMENQPIKQGNIFRIASVSATTSETVNGITIVFDAQNLIGKDGRDFSGKNIYTVSIPEDMLKNNSTAAIASINPSVLNIGSGPGNQFFDASKPSNGVKWGSKGPVTIGNLPSCGQATFTSDVSGSTTEETEYFMLSRDGVQVVSQSNFANSGCKLLNPPTYPEVSSSSTGAYISSSSTAGITGAGSSSSSTAGITGPGSSSSSTAGFTGAADSSSSSTAGFTGAADISSSSTAGFTGAGSSSSSTGWNVLSSSSSSTGGTNGPDVQPSIARSSEDSSPRNIGLGVGIPLAVGIGLVAVYLYKRYNRKESSTVRDPVAFPLSGIMIDRSI